MTRKSIIACGSLIALGLLAGCTSGGVFDRERPDEFAVTRAKPLQVPGSFTLPAPQAEGSVPVDNAETQKQVLDALFGATPGQ